MSLVYLNQGPTLDSIIGFRQPPFSELTINFLSQLSEFMWNENRILSLNDVNAFAFWSRRSNLEKMKSNYSDLESRLGLGTVFHITPANVPINFAFSWALSLLAGNSNIVRVSSREFDEVNFVLNSIDKVISRDDFKHLRNGNCFIRYPHDSDTTLEILNKVDARVLWGSDKTINDITQLRTDNYVKSLVFPSRYSIAVIDAKELQNIPTKELEKIVNLFVSDSMTYLQLGCSSPRKVYWINYGTDTTKVREEFWQLANQTVLKRNLLSPSHVSVRTGNLFKIVLEQGLTVERDNKLSGIVEILSADFIPNKIVEASTSFGIFFELFPTNLGEVFLESERKVQTLCYFGLDKQTLIRALIASNAQGVDRIVPFGEAFEMNTTWDGIDIIRELSRYVEIR
jgi:hypothetical protein